MRLTKSTVDSARPDSTDYELRETIVPGFLCKITPAGRKVFMLSYRTRHVKGSYVAYDHARLAFKNAADRLGDLLKGSLLPDT